MARNTTKVSVIIPVLNEQDSIALVVGAIPSNLVDEIIVVDNDSTDNTAEVAQRAGARVVQEIERGYGAACQRGIAAVNNPDIIVFLDGDYSDFPEEMIKILGPIIHDRADLVIGSRTAEHGTGTTLPPHAYWGNRLATRLIDLLYHHRFTDLGPFRAIRASKLRELNMQDSNYGWTVEMQVKALKRGLRVAEVPVRYRKRIGKSKVSGSWTGSIRAGAKIIFTILALR